MSLAEASRTGRSDCAKMVRAGNLRVQAAVRLEETGNGMLPGLVELWKVGGAAEHCRKPITAGPVMAARPVPRSAHTGPCSVGQATMCQCLCQYVRNIITLCASRCKSSASRCTFPGLREGGIIGSRSILAADIDSRLELEQWTRCRIRGKPVATRSRPWKSRGRKGPWPSTQEISGNSRGKSPTTPHGCMCHRLGQPTGGQVGPASCRKCANTMA
jgi:hypothetical protein